MISVLQNLFYFDWLSFKNWFAKETISKIIIFVVFLLVVGGFSTLLWLLSSNFFSYLSTFESYGSYTSLYIIKATTLTILWLGVVSSIISNIVFLLTPDKKIDYLVTMPIKHQYILIWNGLKSLVLNIFLFLVFILPLALAYLQKMETVGLLSGALRIIGLLIFISLISDFIGSALGFIIANRFKKKDGFVFTLISILLIVGLTVLLFKSIFPSQLSIFGPVSSDDFLNLYNSLPINKYCLINTLLASTLTIGWGTHVLYLLLFTSSLFVLSGLIQKSLFIDTWQQVRVNLAHHVFVFKLQPTSWKTLDLVQKDFISIFRSPKEVSYAVFLFTLIIAFAGLFSRGIEVSRLPSFINPSLIIFSWIWLSFYSITYLMRMCFPLMSKEGKLRWWLFTLPIKPSAIVNSKIITALILSLPLYIVAIVEWIFLPFPRSTLFLSVLSVASLIFFTLVITLLGIIRPDYSLADDPEKASTGLSGLFALTISLVISGFSGLLIYLSSVNIFSQFTAINIFILCGTISLSLLYLLAYKTIKNHSL